MATARRGCGYREMLLGASEEIFGSESQQDEARHRSIAPIPDRHLTLQISELGTN